MKRILITGGSGFLGGHLVTQARDKFEVFSTYFKHKQKISNIKWEFLDLTQNETIELLIKRTQPQIIIHTAALTSVDECENQNELAYLINVKATAELTAISNKYNIRLIFISSDMVYDGEKGNNTENDKINPINFYGKTKAIAEKNIMESCSNFVIARAALIYGTTTTNSRSFSESILQKIKNKQVVKLFFDQFRTPILVDNLTEALLELSEHQFIGTLNLGGSQRINRYDFGVEMAELYNFSTKWLKKCSMHDFNTGAKRPCDVSFNIIKSQTLLCTKFLDIREGLKLSSAKTCKLLTKK